MSLPFDKITWLKNNFNILLHGWKEAKREKLLFAQLVPTLNFSALPFCKDLSELVDPEFIFDSLASHESNNFVLFYSDQCRCVIVSKENPCPKVVSVKIAKTD